MAAIGIGRREQATGLAILASLRAKVSGVVRRVGAWAAAAILVGAVGAVLFQLVSQMLSFPAPVAVIGITVMAAALLNSLRRHLRTRGGHRVAAR